jgi:hypothetical protein
MIDRIIRTMAYVALSAIVVACGDNAGDTKTADSTATSDTASSSSTSETKGTELASSEGGFNVMMPPGFTNPQQSTQMLSTPVGPVNMTLFTSTEDTNSAFMVAYLDYPESAFEGSKIEAMLDGARDSALSSLNATLDKQENVTLDGNPGRSMTFTGSAEGREVYGRIDYFIAQPRLYQILFITGAKDRLGAEKIQNSFSSFKIKKDETTASKDTAAAK